MRSIIMITPTGPPVTGAIRVASAVQRELAARKLVVRVVSTTAAGRPYHLKRAARHLAAGIRILLATRPTTVYQTGAGGLAVFYQALLTMVARLRGHRNVFHHHSFAYLNSPSMAMRLLVACGGSSAIHVALCDSMADRLKSTYRCNTVAVFSNALFTGPPLPPDAIAKASGAGGGGRPVVVVGHLSNLSFAKGLDVVIEAVGLLREGGFDVQLRVAGPAVDEAVRQSLNSFFAGGSSNDVWLGPVDEGQVPEFMKELDVFVFPSRYKNEALPLVVLEAMRQGVPIVSSGAGCLFETVLDGGVVVAPRPDAVAAGIRQLTKSPDAGERARDAYSRMYNRERLDGFVNLVGR